MKIIGIVNSMGDYQGNKYHNLVLHVSYKDTNERKDCQGLMTDKLKLRYSDLNDLLSLGLADPADVQKMTSETFNYLLGKEIEVAYNKFGGIQSLKVLDTNDKK